MRRLSGVLMVLVMAMALTLTTSAIAFEETRPLKILITNVNIFDGKNDKLIMKDGKIYKNEL